MGQMGDSLAESWQNGETVKRGACEKKIMLISSHCEYSVAIL